MSDYVPEHHKGDYWKVVIVLKTCPLCSKKMAQKIDQQAPFSLYSRMTLKTQLERIGAVGMSRALHMDSQHICVECEKKGSAEFECQLCNIVRKTSEIQQSFGLPAEHLCKTCYETVAAKDWETKVDELEDDHQYDFD